ncbi:hypothetical protein ACFLSH_02070 [Bacteroidota bacterium]
MTAKAAFESNKEKILGIAFCSLIFCLKNCINKQIHFSLLSWLKKLPAINIPIIKIVNWGKLIFFISSTSCCFAQLKLTNIFSLLQYGWKLLAEDWGTEF